MRDYKNDETVITAFLTNYSMVEVMRQARISKNTAYKLRRDPEFMEIVRRRKSEIVSAAVGRMQNGMIRAVDALQEIIDDPTTKKATRVNACHVFLSHLRDFTTTEDILRRLEALERPQKPENETVSGVNDENIGS